jgi:hypothetical protein
MTILQLALILAAIYPFLLFWDHRTARNPETGEYKAQRISDSFTLFAPFALLYFHENFWHNLIFYFIPLYVYFLSLAWVMQKKFHLASAFDMLLSVGVGSFVLVIIGYYIFFHKGALSTVESKAPALHDTDEINWLIWWPIPLVTITVLTAVLMFKKIGERAEILLFPVALVLLVVPFFSHHPYWLMMLSTLLFFYLCVFAAKQCGSDGKAAYSAILFFYMMAQMAALIIYAVLF